MAPVIFLGVVMGVWIWAATVMWRTEHDIFKIVAVVLAIVGLCGANKMYHSPGVPAIPNKQVCLMLATFLSVCICEAFGRKFMGIRPLGQ